MMWKNKKQSVDNLEETVNCIKKGLKLGEDKFIDKNFVDPAGNHW